MNERYVVTDTKNEVVVTFQTLTAAAEFVRQAKRRLQIHCQMSKREEDGLYHDWHDVLIIS